VQITGAVGKGHGGESLQEVEIPLYFGKGIKIKFTNIKYPYSILIMRATLPLAMGYVEHHMHGR